MGPALGATAVLATLVALYLPSRVEKFRFPVERAPVELARAEEPAARVDKSLDERLYRLAVRDHELLIRGREQATEDELGVHPLAIRQVRLTENLNVPLHIPTVEGYEEGLAPLLRTKGFFLHFNRNLRQFRPDEQLLELLGVGLIFSDPPLDEESFPIDPRLSLAGRALHRAPGEGAAFWREQAQGVDFAALDAPFWPDGEYREVRNDVMVGYGRAERSDEVESRIRTDVSNPNKVILESSGAVPGDAVLAMGWAPGWVGEGGAIEWLGAVHASVPAGEFNGDGVAVLRYEPRSFRVGLFLSTFGLAVLAAMIVAGGRRKRAGD
jgi:hypothetical protein